MSFIILKPGILDTVQDQGRYGFSRWGVNPGGAMDRFAAGVANMLVGNFSGEAVLEIHFPGPQILFEQSCLLSITGADFTALINDVAVPRWQPIVVRRNTVLHFEHQNWGARAYIAIHGGIQARQWLGSFSTNLKAAAGGHEGRRLEKTDRLYLGENRLYFAGWLPEGKDFRVLPWQPNTHKIYEYPHEVMVLPGREWPLLTDESKIDFRDNNFIVHPSSDRMGYQLRGIPLHTGHPVELLSSGVQFGTLQLMPDGQLVVLMADHQTTGGYPRVAHVISAHWPRLAQLRPSDAVHFNLSSQETAERLWQDMQRELRILKEACEDHLNNLVC